MHHHIDRCAFDTVSIEPQSKVQLLGVTLNSDLSMASHVSRTVSTCFFQLRRLKSIRRSLPIEASKSLVSALVFSRCDNQNGLFLRGLRRGKSIDCSAFSTRPRDSSSAALALPTSRRSFAIACIGYASNSGFPTNCA